MDAGGGFLRNPFPIFAYAGPNTRMGLQSLFQQVENTAFLFVYRFSIQERRVFFGFDSPMNEQSGIATIIHNELGSQDLTVSARVNQSVKSTHHSISYAV